MTRFLAAAVQLNSTSDEAASVAAAEGWIERAAEAGAGFVATPENTNYLGPHEEKVRRAEPVGGPTTRRFGELARRLRIHLLLGSFNERAGELGRCHNTSVLFAPDGEVIATYRKLHLFDVDLSDEVRFAESATVAPGNRTVVVETALSRIGLTICYDLRFGDLYRRLADDGAEILAVPSAFTATTGRVHWEPLLRARAIETQCWVIAPAQVGRHDDAGLRESHGQAMIVDPWGVVAAAVASDRPGFALAEIDLERAAEIRRAMPVTSHRRFESPRLRTTSVT